MMTALPGVSKLCSTCAFWTGTRQIKADGRVEIHPYSKGRCQGGGFQFALMAALATCRKWELWAAAATPLGLGAPC